MGKDKVIHPQNQSKGGDVAKSPNSMTGIQGPSPSMENLQPYNRSSGKKK